MARGGTSRKAIALRDAGDEGPILAWLPTPGDRFDECIARNVDLWRIGTVDVDGNLARVSGSWSPGKNSSQDRYGSGQIRCNRRRLARPRA